MKHIAVYLRVSTDGVKDGREQKTEMQLLDITNYLNAKGITEFEIYEDKGISGTKSNRPSLKRLMNDVRQGKVSMVVCWKLDRLFRSLVDLMNTVTEFQKLEVEFVALKDGIDLSTATGRLMMQIIGAFGEFEAAVIKERINSGIANARSKGVQLGRPFKSGHNVVQKLKDEGKTVKEIALNTGLSRQTVYRSLNKGEQNG
jgi:DNA invertase Pin-like site-specific DNA recombinase